MGERQMPDAPDGGRRLRLLSLTSVRLRQGVGEDVGSVGCRAKLSTRQTSSFCAAAHGSVRMGYMIAWPGRPVKPLDGVLTRGYAREGVAAGVNGGGAGY